MTAATPAIHVIHLIPWLKTGGSENLLRRHVAELQRSHPNFRNTVLVLGHEQLSEAGAAASLACPVRFLELPSDYRRPWVLLRGLRQLRKLLKELRADVVHSYLLAADLYAAIAARQSGLVHVAHVLDRRGHRSSGSLRSRIRVRLVGLLLRWSRARLVAVSDACRDHALLQYRVAESAVSTAHNGIDIATFARSVASVPAAGKFRIGAISRMAAEKGHHYLFAAVRALADSGVACELRLAGPGSDGADAQAALQSAGIAELTTPLGRVPCVADFYREIDVFAISSIDAEGLPTTILEAMASSLPVVASDVGGAREAIVDGVSGLLVAPGDVDALVAALTEIAADPRRAAALGAAARLRVEAGFTTAAMTRAIVRHGYADRRVSQSRLTAGSSA